jgi:hypothetical protein
MGKFSIDEAGPKQSNCWMHLSPAGCGDGNFVSGMA